MSDMIHRIIGLRQDGSYVELDRCTAPERAVQIRRLAIMAGEFTNVLIFWVPNSGKRSTTPWS